MADTYASAKTYVDRTRTRHRHTRGTSVTEDRRSFATFLDRSRGYRVDSVDGDSPRTPLLWTGPISGDDRIRIRLFVQSLSLGPLGPAAMVTLPSLLLPSAVGRSLVDDLHDTRVDGRGNVGASRCHRVFGHWSDHTEVTLWLDEDTFLIRRLEDKTEYPSAREAAELRDAHLGRRDRAVAVGVSRDVIEHAFGAEKLLAQPHWPYARPRQDALSLTTVAYEPCLDIPIDPATFVR